MLPIWINITKIQAMHMCWKQYPSSSSVLSEVTVVSKVLFLQLYPSPPAQKEPWHRHFTSQCCTISQTHIYTLTKCIYITDVLSCLYTNDLSNTFIYSKTYLLFKRLPLSAISSFFIQMSEQKQVNSASSYIPFLKTPHIQLVIKHCKPNATNYYGNT